MEQNWDVLIVLNAPRYDYFKAVYSKFFGGDLRAVRSCGSATPEWFYNNFVDNHYSDVVYISANPYINSKTCTRSYARGIRRKLIQFCAKHHVGRVVDAWMKALDEKTGYITPEKTTIEALKTISRTRGDKRFVIHYIQPHIPFISPDCACRLANNVNARSYLLQRLLPYMVNIVHYLVSVELLDMYPPLTPYRLLLRIIGIDPDTLLDQRVFQLDYCLQRYGCKTLQVCYLLNLLEALKALTPLVSDLIETGYRVVITSDHGELLCEHASIGHWNGSERELLRTVPWLEVTGVKKVYDYPRYKLLRRILVKGLSRAPKLGSSST